MNISNDILILILNKLSDKDLISYILVNKQTSNIYNNQIFWFKRIRIFFPYIPLDILTKTKMWSDYYTKDLTKSVLLSNKDKLLIKSSDAGRLDLIMVALNNGADIHVGSDYPLCLASKRGHLNIVKYLVERGAGINGWDIHALKYATTKGHLDIVKYLVERDGNVCDKINMVFMEAI